MTADRSTDWRQVVFGVAGGVCVTTGMAGIGLGEATVSTAGVMLIIFGVISSLMAVGLYFDDDGTTTAPGAS